MRSLLPTVAAVTALLFSLPALAADEVEHPGDALVEAEADPPASDSAVVDDQDASGGKAVESDRTWEPVFQTSALNRLTGRVTLWVRHRGGPVQLKAVVGGKQIARDWSYKKGEDFQWAKLGTYDAADLGEKVVLIRGKADGTVAVDCVAYQVADASAETPQNAGEAGITGEAAGGGSSALPPDRPDPDKAAVDLDLTIDWSQDAGKVPQDIWGVALFRLVQPGNSGDPAYVSWLRELRPSLVRVHSAEMTRQWWDSNAQRWDLSRIRASFEPHLDWLREGDTKLMVCLPYSWPASVRGTEKDGKYLPPERYNAGMANLRELVIILGDLGVPVTHYEVTNEWDNTYEKAGKLDELWPLINRMANEVRSAAPGTVVGGPAMTWPNPTWVAGLLDGGGEDLDFLSFHGYAAGDPTTPNPAVMARAARMAGHAAEVDAMLDDRGLGDVPVYLTEHNVQWSWHPFERRHANSVGAAFLATLAGDLARQGVAGATVWHAMGDAYGLVDESGRRRATGQLYLWANRHAHGTLAPAALTRADAPATRPATRPAGDLGLAVLPVTLPGGGRTVLLANQTDGPIRLTADAAALLGTGEAVRSLAITAVGASVSDAAPHAVEIPGYSVLFLTTAAADEPPGDVDLPGQGVGFDF